MLAPTTVLTLLAAVTAALLVVAIPLYARQRRRYSARLCTRWGFDPATVRVISSDLDRHRSDRALRADDLAGNPDVLFRDDRNRRIIVGEAKSRHFKGTVTPYERYQVTLYLGMVHRLYRRPVKAILLYGNGRRVPLEFDEDLYRRLLAQIPACRQAMARR